MTIDSEASGGLIATAASEDAARGLLGLALEKERTRRVLIVTAAALYVFTVLAILLAPEGRQVHASVAGIFLIVFSLGAVGMAHFNIAAFGVKLDAGGSSRPGPATPVPATPLVAREDRPAEQALAGKSHLMGLD